MATLQTGESHALLWKWSFWHMSEDKILLGIDVGGTKCAVSLSVDRAGELEFLGREAFPTPAGPKAAVAALLTAAQKLVGDTGCRPAAVVATSVARPARRWKNELRRFQPMIPSQDSALRRRTSEPWRLTSVRSTSAWPRDRARSYASATATTRRTGETRQAQDGSTPSRDDAKAATTISAATPTARV